MRARGLRSRLPRISLLCLHHRKLRMARQRMLPPSRASADSVWVPTRLRPRPVLLLRLQAAFLPSTLAISERKSERPLVPLQRAKTRRSRLLIWKRSTNHLQQPETRTRRSLLRLLQPLHLGSLPRVGSVLAISARRTLNAPPFRPRQVSRSKPHLPTSALVTRARSPSLQSRPLVGSALEIGVKGRTRQKEARQLKLLRNMLALASLLLCQISRQQKRRRWKTKAKMRRGVTVLRQTPQRSQRSQQKTRTRKRKRKRKQNLRRQTPNTPKMKRCPTLPHSVSASRPSHETRSPWWNRYPSRTQPRPRLLLGLWPPSASAQLLMARRKTRKTDKQ